MRLYFKWKGNLTLLRNLVGKNIVYQTLWNTVLSYKRVTNIFTSYNKVSNNTFGVYLKNGNVKHLEFIWENPFEFGLVLCQRHWHLRLLEYFCFKWVRHIYSSLLRSHPASSDISITELIYAFSRGHKSSNSWHFQEDEPKALLFLRGTMDWRIQLSPTKSCHCCYRTSISQSLPIFHCHDEAIYVYHGVRKYCVSYIIFIALKSIRSITWLHKSWWLRIENSKESHPIDTLWYISLNYIRDFLSL